MNKNVVYTSIFGKCDWPPLVKKIPEGWDFICFTDIDFESDLWNIIKVNRIYKNAKDSRFYKINPHIFLNNYENSVWIDGNIDLIEGWLEVVEACLDESNITFLTHPDLVKGPYDEGSRCISLKKDKRDIIKKQLTFYKEEGLPFREKVSATGVLIRKHNKIVDFNNLWWSQVEQFSHRDQISLPYARWKTELDYKETLFLRHQPQWFLVKGHKVR